MSNEKKNKLINPNREPLTPEKLRKFSGLNLSDEEAEEVIWSLIQYARIVYDFTLRHEQSAECENKSELS
jgi:hypothetical protein